MRLKRDCSRSLCLQSLVCNAGLSLSLLQQRLTPTLLPPRISLWISRRQYPTAVPSFTNICKPAPAARMVPSRCPRSSCFSCCHLRRESTHEQPSREPPEKSHYTKALKIINSPGPDIYPASPALPSSVGAGPPSHHAESPEAHASYPPPESPAS
jgi:hypothetical protein